MSVKWDGLKKQLHQARSFAYLNKYKESLDCFRKIIQIIEQEILLNNIPKKNVEEWRKIQGNIIQQKNVVETLSNKLLGFNTYNSSFIRNHKETLQQRQDFQQNRRKTNHNFRSTNRNPSLMRATNTRVNQEPDLSQPEKPLKKQIQSVQKPQKSQPNKSNPSIGTKGSQNHRHLQSKLNKKDNNGKKNFLNDRYPNGIGPDSNLIEMLERQVVDMSPNVTFDDIAQLETAKGLLQQAVLLPLKMPNFFTGIRRAWRGVLMFGPPGTGKTLLAKAVASNGGTTFFNVSASSLASKWKGQSQKLVRILFEMAKYYAPSVIFFDEIDALGGKRKDGQDESNRKVKTELLVQMDGATSSENQDNKFVIVLAATNRPWDLDEALRRRLEKRIYIPLPSEKGRRELVKINMKSINIAEGIDFDFIIKNTEGYSGADITNVCRQAAYQPMRRILKAHGGFNKIIDLTKFQQEVNVPITREDFCLAIKNVNKSVGKEDLKKYQQWMKEFGTV